MRRTPSPLVVATVLGPLQSVAGEGEHERERGHNKHEAQQPSFVRFTHPLPSGTPNSGEIRCAVTNVSDRELVLEIVFFAGSEGGAQFISAAGPGVTFEFPHSSQPGLFLPKNGVPSYCRFRVVTQFRQVQFNFGTAKDIRGSATLIVDGQIVAVMPAE